MIEPFTASFLSPNKKYRRLSVLMAIHDAPENSQHKIGRITHLSSSMVNNYIKEFQAEALIKISGRTNRTQRYHLTAEGHNALMSLLIAYSSEIVQLYGAAKHEVALRLDRLQEEGISKIALFGAAETAEVVHAALKNSPFTVVGIVDSDTKKHGKPFNGFVIQPAEILAKINVDAVVITSFARQEEIYARIRQVVGDDIKVKRLSDL
jgi:hypothetical protein